MNIAVSQKRFQKINLITIVLLFVLILAGGVVRSTGSGMGCPDWPKCFGCMVPPTNVSQLPKDYKQKYAAGRLAKNQRFAKTLDVFGFSDLAARLRQDKSILVPEEFNAVKTWVEYINRLLGEITGMALLITAIYAFSYRKVSRTIVVLSIFNVILVGFQAWFGSIVVSTNLVAWTITVHMLLALAILAIAILTYHMAKTSGKLSQLSDAKLPYISLLTDPTFGGISASFGMLGDLNIAEPGALIGFAGPRVIKETIKKDLPEGFQRSEFLLDHGFLDFIVGRKDLRNKLATILELFNH